MQKFGVRPIMTVAISLNIIMLLVAGTFPYIWVIAITYATTGKLVDHLFQTFK